MGIRNNNKELYKVPISVKGIIFEEGAVWLRKNERLEWELPGGKMAAGEQPSETVMRELKEELGFMVEAVKVIHVWKYQIPKSLDEAQGVLVVAYLCKLLSKTGIFETRGEAGQAEFQKFTLQEMEALNMPKFYQEAIHLGWKEFLRMQ